ncbi:MAG: hypothetical protein Q9195_001962 [Heterodermia aff. obscurata]
MQFAKILFVSASFVAATTAKIAFTTLPTAVEAGVPTKLTWGGGDDSQPVTITLKQGPSTDLVTVAVITGKATGTSFEWTPSKSLPDGDDYALQISQGPDDVNYTGEFTLSGGSAAVPTTSASLSSSASITSAATLSSAISSLQSASSLNSSVSSLVASLSSISNATVTTTTAAGTGAIGTGAGGSLSAATGTVLHRNTTLSSATLTKSKTTSTTASTTSSETASTTAGSSAATTSSSSSDAMNLASPLAFVLFAAGAIVYLG